MLVNLIQITTQCSLFPPWAPIQLPGWPQVSWTPISTSHFICSSLTKALIRGCSTLVVHLTAVSIKSTASYPRISGPSRGRRWEEVISKLPSISCTASLASKSHSVDTQWEPPRSTWPYQRTMTSSRTKFTKWYRWLLAESQTSLSSQLSTLQALAFSMLRISLRSVDQLGMRQLSRCATSSA